MRRSRAYGIAVAAVAVAVAVRLLLTPILQQRVPFTLLHLAAATTAWYAGAGPAVLALLLGYLASGLLFAWPPGTMPWTGLPGGVDALSYWSAGLVLVAIVVAVRAARERVAERARAAGQSEVAYRQMFESNPHPMWVFDGETLDFLAVNDAAVLHYGYTRDEFLRMTIRDLRPTEDMEQLHGGPHTVIRGQSVASLFRHRRKDGTLIDVEVTAHPLRFDGRHGALVLAYDVTERHRVEHERRQAEQALRESEGRFRMIADSVPALVWVTGATGELEFVNRTYGEFLGAGDERTWAAALHPDDAVAYAGAWTHARERRQRFEGQLRLRRADGTYRWLTCTALPRFAADGTYLGHVAMAADVNDLTVAEERLASSNRAKDEFLAMLGHELRNPLSAVRNAIVVARMDPERRIHALDIAKRQTEQLGRLVDDLLDVGRIATGKIMLRRERVFLASIVERAIESVRPLMEERGHALTVSLAAGTSLLDADAARLGQAIGNVLTNAAKYTDPGGRVDVAAERDGDYCIVRVRDTGIGIPSAMLPHVFDAFAQGDQALDRTRGGLGVGLTIVRRIVELHGGSVEARSDGPGRGAEFLLRLPALPATEGVEKVGERPTARPGGRASVLIVEDNLDAADSLGMLLELLGHDVRVTHVAADALDAVRARAPDVAVIDIGLPGMNGYELARRLRALPGGAGMILVALTGYGRDEDKQAARTAGFDHHLTKPVELDVLEDLLGRIGAPERPATIH